MEKVYRILDWLEMEQAVDWLQDLTGTPVTNNELIQLCESKQCAVYADVSGLSSDEFGFDKGIAKGIHLVTNPWQAFGGGWNSREIWTTGDTYTQIGATLLFNDLPPWKRAPIFQPSDIQALSDKMNGAANQPTAAELDDLRDQLKKAGESRDNAWYLTDKYKAELEQFRDAAEQESTSREAAWLRAEQAEAEVAGLRQNLSDAEEKENSYCNGMEESQAKVAKLSHELEQERAAREAATDDAAELKEEIRLMVEAQRFAQEAAEQYETEEAATRYDDWLREQSSHQPHAPATGLTFPYATKHLEAMRDAAIAHWTEHDRSRPAPYGIQKTVQTFLALRTGENARKLAELAFAIKPDDLPKA